jgi:hypothetical protein
LEGEPYLRLDPEGGVHRNIGSPASYLNEDRQARTPVPNDADPAAEPLWQKIGDGSTVRWHDHRVHWMGDARPPTVAADPSKARTVIDDWKIPIRVGERRAALTISAAMDARRLLTAVDPSDRGPRPSPVAQPANEHRRARWTLIVMIVLIAIAIAYALATAPPR